MSRGKENMRGVENRGEEMRTEERRRLGLLDQ